MNENERHPYPAEEDVKWLPYKDSPHKERLLQLLTATGTDALNQLFASLYLLAATEIEPPAMMKDEKVDFDAARRAVGPLGSEAHALTNLAEGLARPEVPIDIRKDLEALSGTPGFTLAVQAIRMRWEA